MSDFRKNEKAKLCLLLVLSVAAGFWQGSWGGLVWLALGLVGVLVGCWPFFLHKLLFQSA